MIQLCKVFPIVVGLMLLVNTAASACVEEVKSVTVMNEKVSDKVAKVSEGYEWPYAIAVGDGEVYVMDGYQLKEDGDVVADLSKFRELYKQKGIKHINKFPETIRVGSIVFKNNKVYIGAVLTDPFLTQDEINSAVYTPKKEKHRPYSGISYFTIWVYDTHTNKMSNLYWHQAFVHPGVSRLDFYETANGQPGGIYKYGDAYLYDWGGPIGYLGRLTVDNEGNIYTATTESYRVEHPGISHSAFIKISPDGKKEYLARNINQISYYRDNVVEGNPEAEHVMINPLGNDEYQYFNGGWLVGYFKRDENASSLSESKIRFGRPMLLPKYARYYLKLKRPELHPDGYATFLIETMADAGMTYMERYLAYEGGSLKEDNFSGGIYKIDWEHTDYRRMFVPVYKPSLEDRKILKLVGDYTFDEDGNIYIIEWTSKSVYKVKQEG